MAVSDLSRMGGLAQHVAESVRRRHPDHVTSGEAEELLARMGRAAGEMATVGEQVLRTRDPVLASELGRRDDERSDLRGTPEMFRPAAAAPSSAAPAASRIARHCLGPLGARTLRFADRTSNRER